MRAPLTYVPPRSRDPPASTLALPLDARVPARDGDPRGRCRSSSPCRSGAACPSAGSTGKGRTASAYELQQKRIWMIPPGKALDILSYLESMLPRTRLVPKRSSPRWGRVHGESTARRTGWDGRWRSRSCLSSALRSPASPPFRAGGAGASALSHPQSCGFEFRLRLGDVLTRDELLEARPCATGSSAERCRCQGLGHRVQIARGCAAHEQIVHGPKPENLFLTRDGQVKSLFGSPSCASRVGVQVRRGDDHAARSGV